MKVLITGVAGFIGYHVAKRLINDEHDVVGVDNFDSFYSPSLKRARLNRLLPMRGFQFFEGDINCEAFVEELFNNASPQQVIHLAAQVGVRHSMGAPTHFCKTNMGGFINVIERCRENRISHFLYASSSSVYGSASHLPFSPQSDSDHPVSIYAATKKSNEILAHAYSTAFGLPTTGLRLFTVYGPWGRPDMAPSLFAHALLAGKVITLFDRGTMTRDFTFVDDVVEVISRTLYIRHPDGTQYRLYNVGTGTARPVVDVVSLLEKYLNVRACVVLADHQPGDVLHTAASTDLLLTELGYRPLTTLEDGLKELAAWYSAYGREEAQNVSATDLL